MNKKIITIFMVATLATFIYCSPTLAITADELKAQINSLQAQINALLVQLAELQDKPTVWCHTFNTNLGVGSSGNEVNALHTALSKGVITGDFGWANNSYDEDTASYVVEFQEKYAGEVLSPYGLKHGTGYVGKTTRAKLNQLFGCNTTKVCSTDVKICPDGSYVSRTGSNCEFAQCPILSCVGEGQTGVGFNNNSCCFGLTQINNSFVSGATCVAPTNGSFACSYCGNGVCGKGENSCNCPSDCKKAENLPPVIDGLTSPTKLEVNEQGKWEIKAHDPENGPLTYSVDWGDKPVVGIASPAPFIPIETKSAQTSTFNHSYSQAGNYTVIFTISDNNYKYIKASATVQVVEIPIAQIPTLKVVSPNGAEEWAFGSAQTIKWTSTGINNLAVYLWFPDGLMCKLATVPASQSQYTVIIQENQACLGSDNRIITPGQYKVSIWSVDEPSKDIDSAHDSSDNFFNFVRPGLPIVSLKIVGSENPSAMVCGSVVDISWSSTGSGFCSPYGFFVPLVDGGNWSDFSTLPSSGSKSLYARHQNYGCDVSPLEFGIQCYEGARSTKKEIFLPILKPKITVVSPNGGETLKVSENAPIKWQNLGFDKFNINIQAQNSSYWTSIATNVPVSSWQNQQTYYWKVPSEYEGNYRIQVSGSITGGPTITDESDGYFKIESSTPLIPPGV